MSRGTFTGLAGWLDEIARYTPDPLIFICANKVDEKGERSDGKSDGKKGGKRVVSEQEARAWAESRHYLYVFFSFFFLHLFFRIVILTPIAGILKRLLIQEKEWHSCLKLYLLV